jgi:serine phosphatase RsbU (regulator of sigma subunit)/PAS domain-containing protein
MDLVSCRNVLIYFDTVLQERVVPIFHYSRVPDGVLLLGRSETVRVGSNLFHLLDKKHHVYSRSPGPGKLPILLAQPDGGGHRWMPKTAAGLQKPLDSYSVQREADEALAQAYAPASVVVDDGHQVLSFRGSTTTYLQHPTGRATLDIFQMAREGLAYELRSALQEAKETEAAARRSGVSVLADGARRSLDLEVTPFRSTDGRIYFVISFREPQMAKARPQRKGKLSEPAPAASQTEADLLRLELEAAREHLQSVSTEKDVSAEELRASFEELQSSNEELQSTNEELETAKEELQSINEELSTVNDELTTRNLELARAHNDLANFVNSVNVPIVMLDRQLRVRRYTPGTDAVLHIVPTDVGRLITQIKPKVDVPDLESVLLEAIESLSPAVRDVKDGKGHWYSMRVRPYQTAEGQVEGAVLTFVDVDELKQSLDHLAESKRLGDAVNEIGISINSTFDFDEIMSRMMERAGKALASQSAAILIAVDSGWTIRHSLGLPEKLLNASFTDAQLPQAALARTTRLPVATPDAGNDERVTPAFRARFEAGPELVVPLMMKDVTLGVLVIGRRAKGPSFNEAECDFGLKLGVAVSLALENASLLRELQAAEIASATLSQILADIAASRDVNQRLGDVLERAAAVLGADRAISAFRGRHGWEIGHVTGLPPELIGSAWGAKEADAFPTRVDPTQPLVVIEASDIRVDSVFLKKHGISSLFLVPLSQAGVVARLFLFGFSSKREIPSKTEEDFLAKLSASVSLGLDNSRSFASEHRLAESLRRRLSPPTPNLSGLDIGAALRMAVEVDNVGGDFYEVFPFDNDHAVLLIGDVMGKGLPAAELTDTIRASARTAALINPSPVFILEMVDRVLRGLDGGARSASGLVAIIDLKTGDLEIAGAGHPPGVLCAATCRLLPHPFGPPLGFAAGPYQSAVSVLNLDETLVLYTDGLIEARRGDEFFGEDRLMEAAARMAGLQVQAMADALINEASEFANGELKDDVAVLVVRRVAPIS